MTIIYSHGSNENLSNVYPKLISLSSLLKCDIIGYDYSGYGKSTGIPKAEEINRDIYEVTHFISNVLKIHKNSIVLFSYSNGASPSLCLACHPHYKHLGGLILLSPIIQTNSDSKIIKDYYEDNINKIERIKIPILIIQGKKDLLSNWEILAYKFKDKLNAKLWFPKDGNHYNIFELYRSNIILKLRSFLNELQSKKLEYLNSDNRSPISLINNPNKDCSFTEQLNTFKTEKNEYLNSYIKGKKNSASLHVTRPSNISIKEENNEEEIIDLINNEKDNNI